MGSRTGSTVKLLGFWSDSTSGNLPDPQTLIDPHWPLEEREWVADYLDHAQVAASWMGLSHCRICGVANGSRDLTDGEFLWPEGLSHYVVEHGVRLPSLFVAHIERRLADFDDLDRDLSWWLENNRRVY